MKSPDAPLAADGGLPRAAAHEHDPYAALDDLMVVIEALCPTWPPRPPTGAGQFKL